MRTPRDLLDRFRPTGSPGAAGPAGVPVDRSALLREELLPVLALLADTEQECARTVTDAEQTAERLRADADGAAAATLAQARADADAARAAAAAQQRRTSDELAIADLKQAESEARRIRTVSPDREAPLVAAALHRAETLLGLAGSQPDATPSATPAAATGPGR